MSLSSLLILTADIERALPSPRTYSTGGTKTWVTIYPDVRCDIQPRNTTDAYALGTEQAFATHRMFCEPADVPGVHEQDRVIYDSRYFEVIGVRDVDELGRLMVLDLLEIKGRIVD